MRDLGTKIDFLRHIVRENKNPNADEMKLLVAQTSLNTDEAFRNVLRDLPTKGPMNRYALLWILNSVRPLTPAELAVCCALDDGGTGSALELGTLRDCISGHPTADFANSKLSRLCYIFQGRVYLHHNRGLGALLGKESTQLLKVSPGSKTESHMFCRCITYLKAIFESWRVLGINLTVQSLNLTSQVHEWAFLEYATMYWPIHCRASGDIHTTIKFLSSQDHFDTWLKVYSIYAADRHPDGEIPSTPIQVAAYFGLDNLFHHIDGLMAKSLGYNKELPSTVSSREVGSQSHSTSSTKR
ncbi:hypothetical protein V8F06_011522 [Rhypophila decipiens]